MSSKQYDIAIIGGSLAARIAATLLAKQGSRVLLLRNREAQAPAWFHSSIFLEKILGVLGGRSCFVAQRPIQVISEKSRLTLCNDTPMEIELGREFGQHAPSVERWLKELQETGTQLEELFWENGGLPWPSLAASARFKLLCLRRRVPLAELEKPVEEKLTQLPDTARAFIRDLLQGLSLVKIKQLSYAQAAMLWAQALRPENLKEPDFSLLLNKRFTQFHGAKEQLDDLKSLDYDGSRWVGGEFKSGGRFTAKTFLLGDKRWIKLFKSGKTSLPQQPRRPVSYRTSNLDGQLSSLLETRVVCGGSWPLRLALVEYEQELNGLILSSAEATEADIRRQLEPILPFVTFTLREENPAEKEPDLEPEPITPLRLAQLPLRIGANIYCADRSALLPATGAAGAALLAWTIVTQLGDGNKQIKD